MTSILVSTFTSRQSVVAVEINHLSRLASALLSAKHGNLVAHGFPVFSTNGSNNQRWTLLTLFFFLKTAYTHRFYFCDAFSLLQINKAF